MRLEVVKWDGKMRSAREMYIFAAPTLPQTLCAGAQHSPWATLAKRRNQEGQGDGSEPCSAIIPWPPPNVCVWFPFSQWWLKKVRVPNVKDALRCPTGLLSDVGIQRPPLH